MANRDDELMRRLFGTFKVEADEHMRAISSGLVELENVQEVERQKAIIERVFREAHSLKGAARVVNLTEAETLCQSLENCFSALKRSPRSLSAKLVDTLYRVVDALAEIVRGIGTKADSKKRSQAAELVNTLEGALRDDQPRPLKAEESKQKAIVNAAPTPKAERSAPVVAVQRASVEAEVIQSGTVRISVAKLNSLLLQAEELLSAKLALGQLATDLREAFSTLAMWEKDRAKLQVDVRALQQWVEGDGRQIRANGGAAWEETAKAPLKKVLDFMERNDTDLKSYQARQSILVGLAWQQHAALSLMVDGLLQDAKKMLMLPFSSILEGFPKLVRDLAHDYGKEVGLEIRGAELEVDRRILEELKDPLIHIVRNCIDHGIESPAGREEKRKTLRAGITIEIARRESDKVEIVVSDDGGGIDLAEIRESALKLGMVTPEEARDLDERATLALLFESGISTNRFITSVSGRGLGLAIVRERVEKLGGSVSVEMQKDVGTSFRMVVPLTLATFRGTLVRANEHCFIFPTLHVERALRTDKDQIRTVENRETLSLNGQVISLVRLGEALGIPSKSGVPEPASKMHALIVRWGEKKLAFQVDEVINEQEVLVKSLGKHLSRVPNVSGATVLGTGQVVPILSIPDLMKAASRLAPGSSRAVVLTAHGKESKKSILVVEDSITARTLLKGILESAGYQVKTAVDGVDALTTLRTAVVDLVVSDVDMPRLNGLGLTAKIRADKKLAELPVVLVTALESREDRERGIDVGANAYIVKSGFDQSNLLDVIRKFI